MNIDNLGVSTSWNATDVVNGRQIVEEVLALGFKVVEVDYRVREEAVVGIAQAVLDGLIKVSSIHNFSPLGRDEKPSPCGGDKLSLASLNESERREAVNLTSKSLELARNLGARALVLHTGEVEEIGRSYFEELTEAVRTQGLQCPEAQRIRKSVMEQRKKARGEYLEAVRQSLVDLLPHAIDANVKLCIENRYFYHQIPIYEDVIDLLELVNSDSLGYWHDIGHGHVMEVLGFLPHLEWFRKLRSHIVGLHIHDAKFIDDHMAPGNGEIDLRGILKIAPEDAIKVLELSSRVTAEEISRGARYLASL